MCSGHGRCNNPYQSCVCDSGFTGGDCSLRSCPTGPAWADAASATDTAHQEAECSNRGTCDRTLGVCRCDSNFSGEACERMLCPNDCSGHGVCRSIGHHAAVLGFQYEHWDKHMIYGCVCDDSYTGYDCSERLCPSGDDPLTTGQLDEVQLLQCSGQSQTSMSFVLTFDGHTTSDISVQATPADVKDALEALPNIRTDGITVAYDSGSEACGGQVVSITFTQNFGDIPALTASAGSSGFDGSITIATDGDSLGGLASRSGTKEDAQCAGRGLCDTLTGACSCFADFATSDGNNAAGDRGDCGYRTGTVTSCPGTTACSGNGVCSGEPEYTCDCSDGFMGADCSLRTCPSGRAWFFDPTADSQLRPLVECSAAGTCQRTSGTCQCRTGFEGAACERLSCPGLVLDCNGHGTCMTMSELATRAVANGQATDLTYGSTPNDAGRWDYRSVQGCLCDASWQGYDCSERVCPFGDDAATPGVDEVQVLRCVGGSGTFRLELGQQLGLPAVTASIDFDANAATVKSELESLTTVGTVSVLINDTTNGGSTAACTSSGSNVMVITFSDAGDIPTFRNLTTYASDLDSGAGFVEVYADGASLDMNGVTYASVQGTREFTECSRRGLCDREQGTCTCFTGYGSSDGQGNDGDTGDCGYLVPIIASSALRATYSGAQETWSSNMDVGSFTV
eukprot:CAMPEP_0196773284 /NCGR_PEP_ID=MMETSP1104-20130614/2673_1 /TAXON_ID=33652 /ORGANISM="Cafeteria sp., Strain Caron Lab Isolate" /LENGTH=680 /DNA_ID=CAMNT_0042143429 /DNA_START=101 /DNA_END=2143 /DNA_ORIENTATION=-